VIQNRIESGFKWVGGSRSGLRIRIPIPAGQNCPPEKDKNEEISNFMFEEFSIELEASPGAWMTFVWV
jgi:hypothetical protein